MRRGRDRAEWDKAVAIVVAVISANSKRPPKYEDIHPHRQEIRRELKQAERLRSRKARKAEADLGWMLMKGLVRGKSRTVPKPADTPAAPQPDA